jgi:protein TonB
MLELKPPIPNERRPLLLVPPQTRGSYDPKQRRLMVAALALLLVALGFVIYKDRDFWFPATQEADLDQPVDRPAATGSVQPGPDVAASIVPPAKTKGRDRKPGTKNSASPAATSAATAVAVPPATVSTTRTVLPPLEVEVIAGDTRRTIRPGSNSVRVDLQPGTTPQATGTAAADADTAARLTNDAAERVQMSTDTTDAVRTAVKPGYPLLARQMKVQGSVILRALIGRDGTIQDLHVMSGPTILASAARDAVRQWRFKPHYQGAEAVETQAKITVNFTISTN